MTTREPGAREVLTGGLVLQSVFDGLLRQQAGGKHDARVGRVRAARDGGDEDRAVTDIALELWGLRTNWIRRGMFRRHLFFILRPLAENHRVLTAAARMNFAAG